MTQKKRRQERPTETCGSLSGPAAHTVILREVGDAERLCKVSREAADCPKLRQQVKKTAKRQRDKHASRHKRNCTSTKPSATILTNSSRAHTNRASKTQIHCVICEVRFQDYARDVPEIAD